MLEVDVADVEVGVGVGVGEGVRTMVTFTLLD